MGAAKPRTISTEKAPKGRLTFVCAGPEGTAAAGAARVRERVAPPAKGRFLVVLSASGAFRNELRKALPKPLGRNRVILDAAPRKGRTAQAASEVDLARLAERAWFYRRLGATHLVIECEPSKGEDVRVLLPRLLGAFAPLAADEGFVIDLILPAKAAAVVHNGWLLSFLREEAAERLGRELPGKLLALETAESEGFALDGSEPEDAEEALRLPASLAGAGGSHRAHGQLGLL